MVSNHIKSAIEKVAEEFQQEHLRYISEADVCARLYCLLKNKFQDEIILKHNVQDKRFPHSKTGRVHLETSLRDWDNRSKVDIAILKRRDSVSLVGKPVWGGVAPAKKFDPDDLKAVIEVKWIFGVPKIRKSGKVVLWPSTPSLANGLRRTCDRLSKLPGNLDKYILFFFSTKDNLPPQNDGKNEKLEEEYLKGLRSVKIALVARDKRGVIWR